MKKLEFIKSKIAGINYKNMHRVLNRVADMNGKSRFAVKADFVRNAFKYRIGYIDYMKGDYVNLTEEDKKSMLTTQNYFSILGYLNNRTYRVCCDDKIMSNHIFRDYLKREYLDMRVAGADGFERFCVGKDFVFAKVPDSYGGKGVKKITVSDITDYTALYKELMADRYFLIEEAIKQHPELNAINPGAVSNVRIITVLKDCKVYVYEMVLRLDDGSSDLISCTDLETLINEKGESVGPVVDDELNVYEKHPVTGFDFKNIKVPMMKEAIELALEAALLTPDVRLIGWDIAISEKGPVIIEVNEYPCYTNYQYYIMHNDGKMKYLDRLKDILGDEFAKIEM